MKEAAAALDVHTSTLRRKIHTGELAALRIGERGGYRVRRTALAELLRPVDAKEARH